MISYSGSSYTSSSSVQRRKNVVESDEGKQTTTSNSREKIKSSTVRYSKFTEIKAPTHDPNIQHDAPILNEPDSSSLNDREVARIEHSSTTTGVDLTRTKVYVKVERQNQLNTVTDN